MDSSVTWYASSRQSTVRRRRRRRRRRARIRSIIQLEIHFHLRTFTIPSDCGSVNAQFRSSFTNE